MAIHLNLRGPFHVVNECLTRPRGSFILAGMAIAFLDLLTHPFRFLFRRRDPVSPAERVNVASRAREWRA